MSLLKKATIRMIKYWWLDKCPICGGKCIAACKCSRSERNCENGHYWRRDMTGKAILLTKEYEDIVYGGRK